MSSSAASPVLFPVSYEAPLLSSDGRQSDATSMSSPQIHTIGAHAPAVLLASPLLRPRHNNNNISSFDSDDGTNQNNNIETKRSFSSMRSYNNNNNNGTDNTRDTLEVQQKILYLNRTSHRAIQIPEMRLEVLEGWQISIMIKMYYLAMVLALTSKVWSDQSLWETTTLDTNEVNNTRNTFPPRRSVLDGDSVYFTIQEHMNNNNNIGNNYYPPPVVCHGGCLIFRQEFSGFEIFHRTFFFALQLTLPMTNHTQLLQSEIALQGWYEHDYTPSGEDDSNRELYALPSFNSLGTPLIVRQNRLLYGNNYIPIERQTVSCKARSQCDLLVFLNPWNQVVGRHTLTLIMHNVSAFERDFPRAPIAAISNTTDYTIYNNNNNRTSLIDVQHDLSLKVIHYNDLGAAIELSVRVTISVLAIALLVHTVYMLGWRNFARVAPNFRARTGRSSRPWLQEQRWSVFMLGLLPLYNNVAGYVPLLYEQAVHGRKVAELLFLEYNMSLYFTYLMRAYYVIILACCVIPAPRLSFKWRNLRQSIIYFGTTAWMVGVIISDVLVLIRDPDEYYRIAEPDSTLHGQVLSYYYKHIQTGAFLVVWMFTIIYYTVAARKDLKSRPYLESRHRQLSFRFFWSMLTVLIIYTLFAMVYCYWGASIGQTTLQNITCDSLSDGTNVGDKLMTGIFVLVLSYVYGPAFLVGETPPDPTQRCWTRVRWRPEWIHFLNHGTTSSVYFFHTDPERRLFLDLNGESSSDDEDDAEDITNNSSRSWNNSTFTPTHTFRMMFDKISTAATTVHTRVRKTMHKTVELALGLVWYGQGGNRPCLARPMFCIELALECFNFSWEVYGEHITTGAAATNENSNNSDTDCTSLLLTPDSASITLDSTIGGGGGAQSSVPATATTATAHTHGFEMNLGRHGYETLGVIHARSSIGKKVTKIAADIHPLHPHRLPLLITQSWTCSQCGLHGHGLVNLCTMCKFMLCSTCYRNRDCDEGGKSKKDSVLESPAQGPAFARNLHIPLLQQEEEDIKTRDLQAVIGVNSRRIIISFRGTSCFDNVKTDIQFVRTVVEEMNDPSEATLHGQLTKSWREKISNSIASAATSATTVLKASTRIGLPRAHTGFLMAYRAIKDELLPSVQEAIAEHPGKEVIVTGHSLGGALATFAAYDIKRFLRVEPTVYTFGAPRVGNDTFAQMYDAMVPNTFRVVNESDIVTSIPFSAFGLLFRHVGIEVCMDRKGNILINPSLVERMFEPTKGRIRSIADHMMGRYARALNAVCNQFRVDPEYRVRYHRDAFFGRFQVDPYGKCIGCDHDAVVVKHCAKSHRMHSDNTNVFDLVRGFRDVELRALIECETWELTNDELYLLTESLRLAHGNSQQPSTRGRNVSLNTPMDNNNINVDVSEELAGSNQSSSSPHARLLEAWKMISRRSRHGSMLSRGDSLRSRGSLLLGRRGGSMDSQATGGSPYTGADVEMTERAPAATSCMRRRTAFQLDPDVSVQVSDGGGGGGVTPLGSPVFTPAAHQQKVEQEESKEQPHSPAMSDPHLDDTL
eukprot:PhM_4_TR1988/c0_g2_i1/m.68940